MSTFASVAFSLHSVSPALTATVTVGASLTAQAEEELQSRQVLDIGRWNRKGTTLYLEGKRSSEVNSFTSEGLIQVMGVSGFQLRGSSLSHQRFTFQLCEMQH